MDPDSTLCFCYHITKRKIVNYVKQTRPRRASQISECFGAGSGCGWCVPFLVKIHREIVEGAAQGEEEPGAAEYEASRQQYLEGVKEGTRKRHKHGDFLPSAPGRSTDERGVSPSGSKDAARPSAPEEPFDYTRYFSRSRPDPEPETLED